VGVGSKILFWHGTWCENQLLKDAFPRCIVLQDTKTHGLKITLFGEMGLCSGMSFLFILYRIGRWM
jgi:hypothetical protein